MQQLIVPGCADAPAPHFVYLPRLNGNARLAAVWNRSAIPGEMTRPNRNRGTANYGEAARSRSAHVHRIHSVCTTFLKMFMNGVLIGTIRNTTKSPLIAIRKDQLQVSGASHAGARGAIRSRSPGLPRAAVSPL